MKTLKLFNAVVEKEAKKYPYISEDGIIIEAGAVWAKNQILKFYKNEKLDGFGLNKTFHKSWKKIFSSSRNSLAVDQILHYISTYGSNFQDEIYIPGEVLDVPEAKVKFKYVRALTKEEMTQKCLSLLESGIALKGQTIDDLLMVLVDELSYTFSNSDTIKNKEAVVKIADMYGVLPTDTMQFFRYVIYRATGDTLLIKSKDVIEKIKASTYNPAAQFEQFGLEKLAEIFNRFKPLFLAFKSKCPKTINKISKLSKEHHKPLVTNPLNLVTSVILTEDDLNWLENATPFALFRALAACHNRIQGQFSFAYRIRNGKSFVKRNKSNGAAWANYGFLKSYLKNRIDLAGKSFFLPENVEYALPTSEKMFVGNIPTGTKFYGEKLAVGVYWENAWGARDLDLSGMNIGGKVGWNSTYNQGGGQLMYSGDVTNAPNGAVEYLYANKGLMAPTLVMNNIYSGVTESGYKIIVGEGDDINYDYMMNPDKLFMETKCTTVQRQMILGMLIPEVKDQCFVLLDFGAGQSRISGNSEVSKVATESLFQQWRNPLTFKEIITFLGAKEVKEAEQADYDFSLDKIEKDSFIEVFIKK